MSTTTTRVSGGSKHLHHLRYCLELDPAGSGIRPHLRLFYPKLGGILDYQFWNPDHHFLTEFRYGFFIFIFGVWGHDYVTFE